MPNGMLRNSPFCSFVSFGIVSLTPFNIKLDSSKDLIILIMSSISSFDIIRVGVPESKTFSCIPASVADTVAVNPSAIKHF